MRRRYAAELVGTFVIVLAPVLLSARGNTDLPTASWVSGLAVLAMIYTLGPVSAAHFNPAVTLGFAVARRFPWRYVLPYWAAQFLGGIAAAALSAALFHPGAGAHVPASGAPLWQAAGLEAVLTFFLMLVIIAVATDRRVSGTVPAIAIGLTVVFDVMIGGAVSGGSMNPARSLGPGLFAGGAALADYWVYLAGPALGAVLAAGMYEAALRLDREHACGAPNELSEALEAVESAGSAKG